MTDGKNQTQQQQQALSLLQFGAQIRQMVDQVVGIADSMDRKLQIVMAENEKLKAEKVKEKTKRKN